MTTIVGTVVLGVCGFVAAYLDIRFRLLPNWLSALTALAGIAIVGAELGPEEIPWALGHVFAALGVGALLFRLGWIGGGDAKFYAGCAAWLPLQKGLLLFVTTSVAGLLLVIVWFSIKGVRRVMTDSEKGKYAQLPYGVAIAVGAILTRLMIA